jgi:phage gp36-like protein
MFLQATELNSSLYPEIQRAISRSETDLVNMHINEALGMIESKLAVKYDIVAEFQKRDGNRHPLLIKCAKDIAIYYLYDLPETIPQKRVKAFDDCMKWLSDLAAGNAVLPGVDPAPIENTNVLVAGNISSGSELKRDNRL